MTRAKEEGCKPPCVCVSYLCLRDSLQPHVPLRTLPHLESAVRLLEVTVTSVILALHPLGKVKTEEDIWLSGLPEAEADTG